MPYRLINWQLSSTAFPYMSFQTYTIFHKEHCTSAFKRNDFNCWAANGAFSPIEFPPICTCWLSHPLQILSISTFSPKWSSLILSMVSLNVRNESGVIMMPDYVAFFPWQKKKIGVSNFSPKQTTKTIKPPNTGTWWKKSTDSLKL